MKKSGNHFVVTVYRVQSVVVICHLKKRHIWYKHHTSDVCMVMVRKKTQLQKIITMVSTHNLSSTGSS
jgi:hypothetical protein